MIEQLERLKRNDMITIDDELSKRLTGMDDFTVKENFNYSFDGQQIIFLELNDIFMIASDLGGETTYAICEECNDLLPNDEYVDEDGVFEDEIEIKGGEESVTYMLKYHTVYEDYDMHFFEYSSNDKYNYLLIYKDEEQIEVYRGIVFNESSIVI